MAVDEQLLAVQQWLNKTYGKVSGYHHVKEDGKHTWETIYALITGLQHELGITELSTSFGPTTAKYFDQQGGIELGDDNNKVKILMGGFWCKGAGFNPGGFDTYYDDPLAECVAAFKAAAGLTDKGGRVDAELMKAILDMSAFTLLANGDANIRTMQQQLNRNYHAYFGILACDGIYQRGTNTALIYALQAEEGLDTATANGNYGDTTTKLTPTLNQGATGNFVKILQWGLYVNGFNQKAQFNGTFDSYIASEVKAFRNFMVLPPVNTTADMTVIKGLLTSAGNTKRDSIACDTATQLTTTQIAAIKKSGFSVIGRYLTGAVGTGDNRRNKYLTVEEINNIVNAGLSIFPLYEDGGYETAYFTEVQGLQDGYKAGEAAANLGFAKGTVIYFAVDVDFQEGDIDGTVIPYITQAKQILSTYGYQTGIYGTRNVCLHAQKSDINYFFVADMSTGWSGNLGFRMPEGWCFDQFYEFTTSTGLDLDQVASSGKDPGCKEFVVDNDNQLNARAHQLIQAMPLFQPFENIVFELDQTYGPYQLPGLDLWMTTKEGWSNITDKELPFEIKNGQMTSRFQTEVADLYRSLYGELYYTNVVNMVNRVAAKIQEGTLVCGLATRSEEPDQIGMKITAKCKVKQGNAETEVEIGLEWYYRQVTGDAPYPAAEYEAKVKKAKDKDFNFAANLPGITMNAMAVAATISILIEIGELIIEFGWLVFLL